MAEIIRRRNKLPGESDSPVAGYQMLGDGERLYTDDFLQIKERRLAAGQSELVFTEMQAPPKYYEAFKRAFHDRPEMIYANWEKDLELFAGEKVWHRKIDETVRIPVEELDRGDIGLWGDQVGGDVTSGGFRWVKFDFLEPVVRPVWLRQVDMYEHRMRLELKVRVAPAGKMDRESAFYYLSGVLRDINNHAREVRMSAITLLEDLKLYPDLSFALTNGDGDLIKAFIPLGYRHIRK